MAQERPEDQAGGDGDDNIAARASASMWTATDAVRIEAGCVIGPYVIEELLGEGGHGEVYRAQQIEPVQRTVAIKIIKPGMDSKAVIARFEQERQALAIVDHPNIARVLDAGTFLRGVPYFVMDYVDGEPITTYCDRNTRSLRERLELFTDVCDAVQHAHMKGIIHRDLKPSNILIAIGDGQRPLVKIIDFGVAKALTTAAGSINTEQGQLIGTREYMSPEQAAMGEMDIDTRTDVYALGVVLYELLSGALPFESSALRKAGQAQIEQILREREPPKPSSRFSTRADAAAVAKNRRTPQHALTRELSRELDWIPLKAMRAERAMRYRTASDMADDIRRYLRGEPLEAGPEARTYRLRKFVCRHRGPVTAAAMILLALIAGLIGVSIALQQVTQQREIAQAREQDALAAQESETRQRERAEAAAERAQRAEQQAGQVADELQLVVDFQASQISTIDTARMGQRIRDGIIASLQSTLEQGGSERLEVEHTIREFEQSLGSINFTNVALNSIEHDVFGRTLDAIDEQFADQPLVKGRLLHTVASTFRNLGLLDPAVEVLGEALEIRRIELGNEHADTLVTINEMGSLLRDLTRYDAAEIHYREALEGRLRLLGPDHPNTLQSINNIGLLMKNQARYADAEAYLREALEGYRVVVGEDHVYTATAALNVGGVLQHRRRFTEAEPFFSEALDGFQRTLGESHRHTLTAKFRLAWLLQELDRFDEAERLYREALDGQRHVLGNTHPSTLTTINNIGWLHFERGNYDAAVPYYLEALAGRRMTLGARHAHTLRSTTNMGMLLHAQGDFAASVQYLQEAKNLSRDIHGDKHTATLQAISNLSAVLRIMGRLDEAEPLIAEAVEAGRSITPRDDKFLAVHLNFYAEILAELGRFEDAESRFLESYSTSVEWLGTDHEQTTRAMQKLADHYDTWHRAEPDAGHDITAGQWRARLGNEEQNE